MIKRTLDVVGSVSGLIILSPLFFLLAVMIKITSRGPIFFIQKRIGLKQKPFWCWKFRTMIDNASSKLHEQHIAQLTKSGSPMSKLNKDPRVISIIGPLLRKTSLDELPQLINVLLGNMSLVGPRPCLPYEVKNYDPPHMRRFDVLPGMTGLWQISGKNETAFSEMVGLDVTYVECCSLSTDIQILLRTVPTVIRESFRKKGIYA